MAVTIIWAVLLIPNVYMHVFATRIRLIRIQEIPGEIYIHVSKLCPFQTTFIVRTVKCFKSMWIFVLEYDVKQYVDYFILLNL